jgi:hypothetical protein
MECRYLAAYKVQGFSNTPDVPDVPLVELQSHKLKATLTGDTDRHCYVLDRQTAVHRLLSLRQADDENLGERLNETIQEIRKNRDQSLNFKASGALVIESCEEIEATLERLARDFGEYAVYFDAINVEEVTESFRDRAAALVSSLAISSSGHYSVEHITDGVYLVNDDGKVVYPFHASDFEGPVSIIDHFSLAGVMNLLRNDLLMRKTGDRRRTELTEESASQCGFSAEFITPSRRFRSKTEIRGSARRGQEYERRQHPSR